MILRDFERSQLDLVVPWFEDAETRQWLGGPDWPARDLDLLDRPLSEFRGAMETARYSLVAWLDETPIGLISGTTTDRWTTWEGGPNGRGVIDVIEGPAVGFTVVVAPRLRNRGFGPAVIEAFIDRPELADVRVFGAGVEPGNLASRRCLEKAGFSLADQTPDWEGFFYYLRYRT